ncbi:Protein N-acetyltransferase, RimJ/RimL family [Pedococcus dokdonensis]|uniref:Protein N-acetyltransferase, RimJ/RimL family n=1 Tax=Pedococcus dokdonensis TaxID=443156 RepID=A0A1H0V7U5_9MICO|nr:GNAT family N-acetyltransferase [Pedococcus dokdonensis]SDP74612.1 Protein N-acetyltransferase, RimJ/RimL family [Pedococcus dokdonensis]
MARPGLTTDRLALRPLSADESDLLVELDGDPAVMAHLTGRATPAEEAIEVWLPQRTDPAHDALGLGYWSAYEGDEFVGWLCLTPTADGEAELGYRLRQRAWGRGLASEGAARLVQHGFETVRLQRIWAETMAVNARSRAVLERIGLRHARTEVREWADPLPGAELGEVVYELTAAEYDRGRASQVRAPGRP